MAHPPLTNRQILPFVKRDDNVIWEWPKRFIEIASQVAKSISRVGRRHLPVEAQKERAEIVAAIKQYSKVNGVEIGVAIDLHGIKRSTFYKWESEYYSKYKENQAESS